jgi:hypothetical protein
MAGTTTPPTLTIPWFPNVHPETPGVLPSRCWVCWGVMVPNCKSIAASQF